MFARLNTRRFLPLLIPTFPSNHDAAKALWIECISYIGLLEAERDTFKKLYTEKLSEVKGLDSTVSSLAKQNLQMERRQTFELLSTTRKGQTATPAKSAEKDSVEEYKSLARPFISSD